MKKIKEVLPIVALSVLVSQEVDAESVTAKAATIVPEKMKASEAAKTAISEKIKMPGSASGSFVKENGPSFVEWSSKQKGAIDKIKGRVSDPASTIDVKSSAQQLQKNQ